MHREEEICTVHHAAAGGTLTLSVLPGKGGRVVSLRLADRGQAYKAIDHRLLETETAGERYGGAPLLPFAGRIAQGRYRFNGHTYSLPVNDRTRGHAIHGLLYDKPFTVTGLQVTPAATTLELTGAYSGEAEGYPFPFGVRVVYRLEDEGFCCTTSVTNSGPEPMPLTFGWHPYLRLAPSMVDWQMKLPLCSVCETGPDLIPTGQKRPFSSFQNFRPLAGHSFNTTFALWEPKNRESIQLFCPGEGHQLQLWMEAGKDEYSHFHLYTPPESHLLAIEPMRGAADGFNSGEGLQVLRSGETVSATYGITYQYVHQ